ncbi:hypothetical protein [Streptomyces sp. XD-27]|uniref:hypothetical protein n=1 Tax=Streptomyces sp. XD-27 TaxID=3062779 RepID=UPI0026F44CB5|nr:hypothetical protein [Streptomyces sp. XD-27]WKX73103.1 hypothetical protein Q3Y56_27285 [Streptomyces sp. XD-27]
MKKATEVVGLLVLLHGAIGLIHAWTGWFGYWGPVRRLPFLEGHEGSAHFAMVLAGLVLLSVPTIVGDALQRRAPARPISGADPARRG